MSQSTPSTPDPPSSSSSSPDRRAASQTAVLVAAYRGRASAEEEPLCSDPWAAQLAGDQGVEFANRYDQVVPHCGLWIALRTAWLDARLNELTAPTQERNQVVILGAGLDTRAARLARPGLRFFEVDHPASQREKQQRLESLSGYPMQAAQFVACDFEFDDFMDRLIAEGFDPALPALILWEGVTPYLSEESVRATTSRIAEACHPRTVLLFDYIMKKLALGGSLDATDSRIRTMIEGMGEPFVFGINDPLPLLQDAGFRHVRTINFDEICLSLTGSYDRDRKFRFQSVVETSREAWPTVTGEHA